MRQFSCVISAVLLLLGSLLSMEVQAWGKNGHRIVGAVAENHLTDEAKQMLMTLIPNDSLAEVSTWADEMRSHPDPIWKSRSKWHYINFDLKKPINPADYQHHAHSHESEIQDIYGAMQKAIAVLKSQQDQQQKIFYLKWLVHLVGDVHQPLHVGNAEDKGGNTIEVEFFWDETNLHRLWDTELIEQQDLSFTEFAQFIDRQDQAQITALQQTPMHQWVMESKKHAATVYAAPRDELSYGYVYDFLPLVKQQLWIAGVRLAGVLNQIAAPQAR